VVKYIKVVVGDKELADFNNLSNKFQNQIKLQANAKECNTLTAIKCISI